MPRLAILRHFRPLQAVLFVSLLAVLGQRAIAQDDLYWDPTTTVSTGGGGTGIWTTNTWYDANTPSTVFWSDNNNAFFNGGSGAVTLNATVTANNLTFTAGSGAYTIDDPSSSLQFVPGATLTNNSSSAQTFGGSGLVIQTTAGNGQLNLDGTGNLNFNLSINNNTLVNLDSTFTGVATFGGANDNGGMGLTVNGGTAILAKTDSSPGNPDIHAVGGPGLTVNGGLVQFGGGGVGQIYQNASTQLNGGVFDLTGTTQTFAGLFASAGQIINSTGAGVLQAPVTLNGGPVAVGATSNASDSLTFSNAITGGGSLTINGPGSTIFNAANSYTGTTTIAGGILTAGVANALPSGAGTGDLIVNSPGSFNLNGLAQSINGLSGTGTVYGGNSGAALTIGSNGDGGTFSGTLADATPIVKVGAGTQTFSGPAIASTGNVTVSAGTLTFADAIYFGNTVGPNGTGAPGQTLSVASGATLNFSTSTANNAGDGSNQVLGVANGGIQLVGNGTFEKSGAGVLSLGGQGTAAYFTNVALGTQGVPNSGLIDIEGGTLKNGGWAGAVWSSNYASLNVASGATFDYWDGKPVQIDALTGAGTVTKGQSTGGYQTLTIGDNNGSGTFSGNINDGPVNFGIAVTKEGTGTETFTSHQNYSGGTIVNGGTLALAVGGQNGTLASGSTVTINGGGTLLANATDVLGYNGGNIGQLNINEGGIVQTVPGARVSQDFPITLIGGTLGGNNAAGQVGDGYEPANYTVRNVVNATQAADGTASTFSGVGSLDQGGANVFNVTSGGAGPVDLNVTGTLIGGGSLNKTGNGVMVLSGTNTYSGSTTVTGGLLNVTGSIANNSSSSVSVQSGGSSFGGAGTTVGGEIDRTIAPGATYAGYGSQDFGANTNGTHADILAGTNTLGATESVPSSIDMSWRNIASGETVGSVTDPPFNTSIGSNVSDFGLISDVLNLHGLATTAGAGSATDPFELSVTYNASLIPSSLQASAVSADLVRLDWLNPATGLWNHATAGDFATGSSAVTGYQGSFAQFEAQYGVNSSDLAQFLGSWGTGGGTAWAIIDHNSAFAVGVPEPSSFVLGGLGLAGLLALRRRQRNRADSSI